MDSAAIIAEVETALERELSVKIMQEGKKPEIRSLQTGETAVEQGSEGNELLLLLDGVLRVLVDGEAVAEVGPGSILGERAVIEGGMRTSTLQAVTPVKLAVARSVDIEPSALEELAQGHRREDP